MVLMLFTQQKVYAVNPECESTSAFQNCTIDLSRGSVGTNIYNEPHFNFVSTPPVGGVSIASIPVGSGYDQISNDIVYLSGNHSLTIKLKDINEPLEVFFGFPNQGAKECHDVGYNSNKVIIRSQAVSSATGTLSVNRPVGKIVCLRIRGTNAGSQTDFGLLLGTMVDEVNTATSLITPQISTPTNFSLSGSALLNVITGSAGKNKIINVAISGARNETGTAQSNYLGRWAYATSPLEPGTYTVTAHSTYPGKLNSATNSTTFTKTANAVTPPLVPEVPPSSNSIECENLNRFNDCTIDLSLGAVGDTTNSNYFNFTQTPPIDGLAVKGHLTGYFTSTNSASIFSYFTGSATVRISGVNEPISIYSGFPDGSVRQCHEIDTGTYKRIGNLSVGTGVQELNLNIASKLINRNVCLRIVGTNLSSQTDFGIRIGSINVGTHGSVGNVTLNQPVINIPNAEDLADANLKSISGTAERNSTVELTFSGAVNATENVRVNHLGNWTYTSDTNLPSGAYTLSAKTIKAPKTNSSIRTVTFNRVIPDTTAPTPSISVTGTPAINAPTSFSINSGGTDVVSLTINYGDDNEIRITPQAPRVALDETITREHTYTAPGTYMLRLSARDTAGNVGTYTTEIELTNNSPTITLSNIDSTQAQSKNVTVTVSDANEHDTLTAYYKVKSANTCAASDFSSDTDGTQITLTSNSGTITLNQESQNTQYICARVHDGTDFVYAVSGQIQGIDRTPPTITINSVATDDLINTSERTGGITVTGTTEENSTVTVQFGTGTVRNATVTGTSYTVDIPEAEIPTGDNVSATITVAGTDQLSNTVTETHDVTIDTTSPTQPTTNSIATDDFINASERTGGITVTGTTEENSTITVQFGTGTVRNATVTGTSYTVDIPETDIQTSDNVSVTITVIATDQAGNTSQSEKDATIDTTAPSTTGTPALTVTRSGTAIPTPAFVRVGDVLTLTFTTSEALRLSPIITIGRQTATVTNSGNNYTATHQASSLTREGLVEYTIGILTDTVGNTTASSTTATIADVTIDTTVPTLTQGTAIGTTNDNTPSYTFTSNEAGTITYGGSCSSSTTAATNGSNTITLNQLADNTYNDCTITVTDTTGNTSSALTIQSFKIDTVVPTASIVLQPSEITSTTTTATATITFSESVTGLAQSEVTTTHGTVASLTGSGTTYTVTINSIPANTNATGTVTVAANAAQDTAGNSNAQTTKNFTINTIASTGALTLTITISGEDESRIIKAVDDTEDKTIWSYAINDTNVCPSTIPSQRSSYIENTNIPINKVEYIDKYFCFYSQKGNDLTNKASPQIEALTPSINNSSKGAYRIKGSPTQTTSQKVRITITDSNSQSIQVEQDSIQSGWDISNIDISTLQDGDLTVSVIELDSSDTQTASNTKTITKDTVSPSFSQRNPVDPNGRTYNTTSPTPFAYVSSSDLEVDGTQTKLRYFGSDSACPTTLPSDSQTIAYTKGEEMVSVKEYNCFYSVDAVGNVALDEKQVQNIYEVSFNFDGTDEQANQIDNKDLLLLIISQVVTEQISILSRYTAQGTRAETIAALNRAKALLNNKLPDNTPLLDFNKDGYLNANKDLIIFYINNVLGNGMNSVYTSYIDGNVDIDDVLKYINSLTQIAE